jgi:hypothetical protein
VPRRRGEIGRRCFASIHRVSEKSNSRKPVYIILRGYALGPGLSPLLVLLGLERFHKMLGSRIKMQGSPCTRHGECPTLAVVRPLQDHPSDRPETVSSGRRRSDDCPGPSTTVRRVTVPEAAETLGVTTDAVRSRMRRGKLRREEGEDGTVYVVLEADGFDGQTTAEDRQNINEPTGEDGQRTVEGGQKTVEDGLVEVLQDQVSYLRDQLEEAHRANAEHRRLLAAALERIPAIEEAPSEPRESDVSATDDVGERDVPPEQEQRRSWLHRFFFGP